MERKSYSDEQKGISSSLRRGGRYFLAATILGMGFFGTVSEVNAQGNEKPESSRPTPPLFNPRPFEQLIPINPIFAPRPPVDIHFYAGCELGTQRWEGRATHYYPGDGCQGCSENNLTAMGVPLDYVTRTIAFNRLPLESRVKVTNKKNGLSIDAMVTDRGGFEKYNFIADLGPAVLAALKGDDITDVEIRHLINCR